jgi:hypothetical protein
MMQRTTWLALAAVFMLGAPCATTLATVWLPPYEDGSAYDVRLEQDQEPAPAVETWVTVPGALRQGDCILGEREELVEIQYCIDTAEGASLCSGKPVPCCPLTQTDCPPEREICAAPVEICARLFSWPNLDVPLVVNDAVQ